MPSVTLGNISPIAVITDPDTGQKTRHRFTNIEQSTCYMGLVEPDLFGQMREVINLWREQSDQPPAWLESDDADLADTMRKHFGCGERPVDWVDNVTGPPETEPFPGESPFPAVVTPPTPVS